MRAAHGSRTARLSAAVFAVGQGHMAPHSVHTPAASWIWILRVRVAVPMAYGNSLGVGLTVVLTAETPHGCVIIRSRYGASFSERTAVGGTPIHHK
jgi:hypothetical protein